MRTDAGRLTQWTLLCALVFGVVGMHHLTTADNPPASVVSMAMDSAPGHGHDDHPSPTREHDILHLCMAVILAAAALLMWLLLRTFPRPASDRHVATCAEPRAPDRPPPLSGRPLLTSLCVLRH